MSYRFTRYQPKYREEIVRLQTVLWGPDLALNTDYLSWKYERNPYLDVNAVDDQILFQLSGPSGATPCQACALASGMTPKWFPRQNDVGPMRVRLGNCSSFSLEASS